MSMIDAYRIGVELIMGGNMAQGVEALIPGLTQLDEKITHANIAAKELAASLAGIGRSASGIGRAAEAMERLRGATAAAHRAAEDYRAGSALPPYMPGAMPTRIPQIAPPGGGGEGEGRALMPHYSPNFTTPGGGGPDASFMEHEGRGPIPLYPNGRPAEGGGGHGGGRGGHIAGAFDDVIPMLIGGEVLKNLFEASFDVGAKETALLQNGWTPDQVKAARAQAQALQVALPGASIGGGLEVDHDLGSLFRTPEGLPDVMAVTKALPSYMKDALVLGARGKGDGYKELFDAARAGDLKGTLNVPGTEEIDADKFGAFVHRVVLADIATGGKVTPHMMLQNIRTGGVAAAMMGDDETFGGNLSLIEGMGAQAASALSGFNRQFGAGRMGKGIAGELEGIFPGLKDHWHSVGMGQVMVDPGAMGNSVEMARNPLKFIEDTIKPGLDKLIAARTPGFEALAAPDKMVLESQEASRIASSVTGSKFIAETLRLFSQQQRERATFLQAEKTDPYKTENENNPQMQVKALQASWNAFEVSLGEAGQGPAIAALNALTGALNEMSGWAKANPDGSKMALEGMAGAVALFGVTAAAGLAMAALASPVGGFLAIAAGIIAVNKAMPDFVKYMLDLQKGFLAPGGMGEKLGGGGPDSAIRGGHGTLPNGGDYTPMAYHPGAGRNMPRVQSIIHLEIDGRTIAHAVTKEQVRMMGGQVQGTLRPDPTISPQYGAHLMEL